MKNKNPVVFFLSLFFAACASGQYGGSSPATESSFYVTIDNATPFDISVFPDACIIPGGTDRVIRLPVQNNQLSEGYRITYYVKIAGVVVKAVPLENKIIKKDAKIVTIDNISFVGDESFFVIKNESKSVIKVRRTNSETYRPGLGPGTAREGTRIELHPGGNTFVYTVDAFSCSVQNERGELFAIPPNIGGEGFVNYFTFDGSAVTLTDALPLHREPVCWAETIREATRAMPLVTTDGEIHLFVPRDRDIIRYVFDSAGNNKERVTNGDGFIVSAATRADNGFLVAGYTMTANGIYRPIARIYDNDGTMRCSLEPSQAYRRGRLFTAAQKDNATWLVAGDGAETGDSNGAAAYIRLIREEADGLKALWELGGNDLRDAGSGIRWANIQAAAYDHARNCWVVTGETTANGAVSGSYIAAIRDNGTLQNIDYSFKNMSFFTALTDTNGNWYFAGKERRGRETYAVVVKYSANGGGSRRLSSPVPSHSYYRDALLDEANNRIILAGVLRARTETGQGGIPFIEAVDCGTGNVLWREEFTETENTDPTLKGTALVTGIAPAPDYGFALALSGVARPFEKPFGKPFGKPFVLARVNYQGKGFITDAGQ